MVYIQLAKINYTRHHLIRVTIGSAIQCLNKSASCILYTSYTLLDAVRYEVFFNIDTNKH